MLPQRSHPLFDDRSLVVARWRKPRWVVCVRASSASTFREADHEGPRYRLQAPRRCNSSHLIANRPIDATFEARLKRSTGCADHEGAIGRMARVRRARFHTKLVAGRPHPSRFVTYDRSL